MYIDLYYNKNKKTYYLCNIVIEIIITLKNSLMVYECIASKRDLVFNLNEHFDIDILDVQDDNKDYDIINEICSKSYIVDIEMVGTEDEDDVFYRFDEYERRVDEEFTKDINRLNNFFYKRILLSVFNDWVDENSILNMQTQRDWELEFY